MIKLIEWSGNPFWIRAFAIILLQPVVNPNTPTAKTHVIAPGVDRLVTDDIDDILTLMKGVPADER